MSPPRKRFWCIPVPKIDSPTRQPLIPRPARALPIGRNSDHTNLPTPIGN
ncbi:MAG: hypothetical protein AB2815_11070 [Candidatus Sedimenticola endophacoides]